jgi:2-amino-4-hydroxy-6-hydroxymethyldihydropteridine diphosphokinase
MRVVYSLGSNLGDRVAALRTAVSGLAVGDAQLVAVSPVYETEPWGVVGHPDYLNVVAVYEVPDDVDPHVLLRRGLALEDSAGRRRDGTVAPRPLDVDLIAVGDLRVESDDLDLPHPRAHQRGFVLIPWSEADPTAILPGHGAVSSLADRVGRSGLTLRADLSVSP